jgi:hypothetical protein
MSGKKRPEKKKMRKRVTRASFPSASASLQWLCPSTREEEEVIDSHNPNSLMVAELDIIYLKAPEMGIPLLVKVKKSSAYSCVETLVSSAILLPLVTLVLILPSVSEITRSSRITQDH